MTRSRPDPPVTGQKGLEDERMVVHLTSRRRTSSTALTVPGKPLVEAKGQNFARNLLQVHSLGPQQGVARGAEEVALPPLTPPPLS